MEPSDDLKNRFTYHKPKPESVPMFEQIRGRALDFAAQIEQLTPPSRERALALTKLEESVMWANAAIARNQ